MRYRSDQGAPMIKVGTRVGTHRTDRLRGTVVGYGTLQWPSDADRHDSSFSGDVYPIVVYLVHIDDLPGSSSLGPACRVFSAEFIYELDDIMSRGYDEDHH